MRGYPEGKVKNRTFPRIRRNIQGAFVSGNFTFGASKWSAGYHSDLRWRVYEAF